MKVVKSIKDPKKVLAEKEEEKIAANAERKRVGDAITNSEKSESFITTWHQHMENRDEIKNFTTIANGKLYNFTPMKDCILLPFSEYFGTYEITWIISWNNVTKKEEFRKNAMYVDMIEWQKKE